MFPIFTKICIFLFQIIVSPLVGAVYPAEGCVLTKMLRMVHAAKNSRVTGSKRKKNRIRETMARKPERIAARF